jgi:hypothetical protein
VVWFQTQQCTPHPPSQENLGEYFKLFSTANSLTVNHLRKPQSRRARKTAEKPTENLTQDPIPATRNAVNRANPPTASTSYFSATRWHSTTYNNKISFLPTFQSRKLEAGFNRNSMIINGFNRPLSI